MGAFVDEWTRKALPASGRRASKRANYAVIARTHLVPAPFGALPLDSLPQPLAIHAPVTDDVGTRTLTVRRPETAGGSESWRGGKEAHAALVKAEESVWSTAHSFVWAGDGNDREIVRDSRRGGNAAAERDWIVGLDQNRPMGVVEEIGNRV